VSPASAGGATSWILILMTVLLGLSLAAIVRSPPWTPDHAGQEPASEPDQPESAAGRHAGALPRRAPGESGWVAPANGELTVARA
jgi:hypothetical protein